MTRPRRPPSAETIELETKILDMRRKGVAPVEIARELQIPKSTVSTRYKAALTRTLKEPAAEVRDLEADRLDKLQAAVWDKAMKGSLPAVDRILRIMDRRAELLGLDHKHGLAERALQVEADKVRLMAVAAGAMFDALNLDEEQRVVATRVLLEGLRAEAGVLDDEEPEADPDGEPDVVVGEVER